MTAKETTETTPEQALLNAAKAILAYPGMPDFIGSADPTAAYAIKTDDLAALHEAVVALDTSV